MLPLFCRIVEVKEVEGQSKATWYLKRGWLLLCVVGFELDGREVFKYSLGRPESVPAMTAPEEEVIWADDAKP